MMINDNDEEKKEEEKKWDTEVISLKDRFVSLFLNYLINGRDLNGYSKIRFPTEDWN